MSGIVEYIQVMGERDNCSPFPTHCATKTEGCPGVCFKSHKIHMCHDQVTLE